MKKSKAVICFSLVICICISLITVSVAWFAGIANIRTEGEFSGESIAAYFGKGDGSKENPYYIVTAQHVYNFAWLQNAGAFNNAETYFKLCDLDGQPINLDMAGELSGTESTSGAIPPIGTEENPFIGHFDGCGSTISNLWVSTKSTDWKEQPDGSVDYSDSYVGLFGFISDEAIVENFVLDRIELKVHTSATIGIVCGYVDAMIKNIGIYNGIITLDAGAAVNSGYSLLGEKSERIEWTGLPSVDSEYGDGVGGGDGTGSAAGGDLIIDPNDYANNGANEFSSVSNGSSVGVPGAIPGTAYYIGTLNRIECNQKGTLYDMRRYVSDGIRTDFDDIAEPSPIMQKIKDMYTTYQKKDTLISPGIPFDESGNYYNGTAQIKDRGNKTITVPRGGIWFKPISTGTVGMAFCFTDKGGSERCAKLYVCQRTFDPDVANDTGTLSIVKTIDFVLPTSGFSNGDFVYFEYEIPAEDKGKYEYIIGKSSTKTREFGFFALVLAGTNETGGDSDEDLEAGKFYPVVIDVDYVLSSTTNVSAEDYVNHQTLLRIDYTSSSEERKIYYLAAGTSGSSLVYYYTSTGVTVTDISVHKESSKSQDLSAPLGSTNVYFSEREEAS